MGGVGLYLLPGTGDLGGDAGFVDKTRGFLYFLAIFIPVGADGPPEAAPGAMGGQGPAPTAMGREAMGGSRLAPTAMAGEGPPEAAPAAMAEEGPPEAAPAAMAGEGPAPPAMGGKGPPEAAPSAGGVVGGVGGITITMGSIPWAMSLALAKFITCMFHSSSVASLKTMM